ncbi:MAG TPA: hypothetical protein VJ875_09980 [Pyrinomonadaceae bacterium]|nr:hypothetical protein [Pyrinomonadaceae bacterium]
MMDHYSSESPTHLGSAEADAHDSGKKLAGFLRSRRYAKYMRFVFAALGSIPWVGGLISASAALHAEREQGRVNELSRQWVEEHQQKIQHLNETLAQMISRLEQLGPQVEERLGDESYLGLVRYGFRVWDEAGTHSTRERVRQTLTNAAGTRICSDDVIRLFLLWLRNYDELHMRVVSVIHNNPGATRAFIWEQIHGEEVREDSAEADLFKLMIRDLSTGGVIRQHRHTTADGHFLSKRVPTRKAKKLTLESAFEDSKPYELTKLGTQFVHYAMSELVPRIGTGA